MTITTLRHHGGATRRLALAGASLGLLGTLAVAPHAVAASGGTPVDGVWLTDGYGSVIEIADGRAQSYETTSISCAKGPAAPQTGPVGADGTVRFADDGFDFTVKADRTRTRAVLHIDSSAGDRHLRRLAALPAACTRPGPTGPLATFDVFWTTFAENYPFFAAKGVDWDAVRDRYRPRVRPDMTGDQLFDLLAEAITPLGDAHTGIRTDKRQYIGHRPGTTFPTQELENKIKPFIVRRDLDGRPLHEFARGRIGYADLPGHIGYLRLIAFAGYTEDGYAADAADPTRFTRPQRLRVQPAKAPIYTGPIAVLTGGSTISAGETFTQALLDRSPRPVRIGANTQGVFSDTLVRTLPNGWMFILPNEEFLTRSGRTFDGTGIPPHVRTPVFTDEEFAENRDSAFDRAVALLRHQR